MSRLDSDQTAFQAALAEMTPEVFLWCLTFDHDDITPVRVVNDRVDLVRGSDTYVAFPFTVKPATQSDQRGGGVEIAADNVDQTLIETLRTLPDDVTVTVEAVRFGNATAIWGPLTVKVRALVATLTSVQIITSPDLEFVGDAFPGRLFQPSNAIAV